MQDDTLVMVLAGGVGERLYPLTKERAKPAVYFGGPYRIIDFTLSNCINSGLRRIFIALQYKSLSLSRHLRMGWSVVADELGEFVEILSPQKRVGEHWYLGTADAVYQNLYSILREEPRHLIVLSGDHVYKMDYAKMLRFHLERGAGATLAVIEIPSEEAHRFGVLAGRRRGSADRLPREAAATCRPASTVLASMGIYIFDMQRPGAGARSGCRALDDPRLRQGHHPGADREGPGLRLPLLRREQEGRRSTGATSARSTRTTTRTWTSATSTRSSTSTIPEWPLRTNQVQAPPAKFVFADDGRRCGQALDSIISAGCIVSGSRVSGSVLCPNVRVHSFCEVDQSILMPGVRVGRHARIRRAIIDRDVFIPRGALIGYNAEEDRRRHTVTDSGIVVVTTEDQPFIGEISEEALRNEAEFDRRGA